MATVTAYKHTLQIDTSKYPAAAPIHHTYSLYQEYEAQSFETVLDVESIEVELPAGYRVKEIPGVVKEIRDANNQKVDVAKLIHEEAGNADRSEASRGVSRQSASSRRIHRF